jgi:8-oxo-dGTP pyrophosphatase MutT (NUDIX family)
MYITREIVSEVEQKYGEPDELSFAYEMEEREFDLVHRSQKHRRAHDVTLFIIDAARIVVIKKPMYPLGAYRAPSGGIDPGEPFETGAVREAYEETGLHVALEEYILRARVKFSLGEAVIDWTSHVLVAGIIGGKLEPIDTHEIVEARFATIDELTGSIRSALLASGSTGLRYRAELNDEVIARLVQRNRIPHSSPADQLPPIATS